MLFCHYTTLHPIYSVCTLEFVSQKKCSSYEAYHIVFAKMSHFVLNG